MRTMTTSVTVCTFDELEPAAQQHAVRHVAEREAARGWDNGDLELIECAMVYALAGTLKAPGWDTCGEVDFPAIDRVTVCEWDLDRARCWHSLGGWTGPTHPGCRGWTGSSRCS